MSSLSRGAPFEKIGDIPCKHGAIYFAFRKMRYNSALRGCDMLQIRRICNISHPRQADISHAQRISRRVHTAYRPSFPQAPSLRFRGVELMSGGHQDPRKDRPAGRRCRGTRLGEYAGRLGSRPLRFASLPHRRGGVSPPLFQQIENRLYCHPHA